MAASYEYLGAVPTTELVGTSQTRQAQSVSARAIPSGYAFTTTVAALDFKQPNLGLILDGIADAINKAGDEPGVVDLNVYDDVDGSGQFVHKLAATVESASGMTTVDISPPYGSMFDARFAAEVKKARARMAAIEGA